MQEKLEVLSPDSTQVGRPCNLCAAPLAPGDEVVECPRCHKFHHADCWKAKGGCATTGCPQVAEAVVGEKPKGDGPPPPIPLWYFAVGGLVIVGLILLSVFWPKPPDPAMGRTKIVVMDVSFLEMHEALTPAVEEFNATSATTYIDLQLLPSVGLQQKLVVLIAAGDAPDIFGVEEDQFELLASQGSLLELGQTPEGEPIYGVQHPGRLAKLVIWGQTENPEIAREVLDFLLEHIPRVDLDKLRELQSQQNLPIFGF
ncbi:MAG: extracellular solute-binding protein [Firmicutes bacterium]|nr:extracellular solute-binding protein [Bacillota bacterium]